MEASTLTHAHVASRHGRSPLLGLQTDERLVALVRRGSNGAFEALVARYEARLLAFCRHMLGSREDAEDVLQEVFAAAYGAIQADDRPLNVRPWLYRIARNRSLNHLRRKQAVGVDSMDVHWSDHGQTTAEKAHKRQEFRDLVSDVGLLPEGQRSALLLREMQAFSYDQIAEAMDTTVPSVKSLLVRARVSLAECAQARGLSCEEVRQELGEVAEGLRRRADPASRRHLRTCKRCAGFRTQLRKTNRALAAVFPVGPALLLKKLALAHFGTTAGAGGGAAATGAGGTAACGGAAGTAAASTAACSGSALTGAISAAGGTVASKAAAGMAAAALVTAGAVEVQHVTSHSPRPDAHSASAPARASAPWTRAAGPQDPAKRRPGETKPGEKAKAAAEGAAVGPDGRPLAPGTAPAAPPTGGQAAPAEAAGPVTDVDSATTTLPTPAPPAPIHVPADPAADASGADAPEPAAPPPDPAPTPQPEPAAPPAREPAASGGSPAPSD